MSLLTLLLILLVVSIAINALFMFYGSSRKEPQRRGPFVFQEEYGEEITPDPPRFDQNLPDLPIGYRETILVLMAKDPYHLYAYWELGEDMLREKTREYGVNAWLASQPYLRLHDESGAFREIALTLEADNWSIGEVLPNRTYRAFLGRKLANGHWVELVRSHWVSTPPAGLSDVIDPEWPPLENLYTGWQERHGQKGLASETHQPKKG